MPDIHVWLGDAEPGTVNVILHAGTPPAETAAEPGDASAAMLRRMESYSRSGRVRPAYDALTARHLYPQPPRLRPGTRGGGNPELRWTLDPEGRRTVCYLHSQAVKFRDSNREQVSGMPGADDRSYAVSFAIGTEAEVEQAMAAVDAVIAALSSR